VRRIATWILVGAVAALGTAAAVDALRGDEEATVQRTTAPQVGLLDRGAADLAVRELREADVSGVLIFSDEDCRLHAISLPELEPARAPSFEMCRPATATGGLGAVDGDVVWAGLGYGAKQVVLSRQELSQAIGFEIGPAPGGADYRAAQAVPLGPDRVVVLADSDAGRVATVIEDGRAVVVHPRSSAVLIRSSPRGAYYALFAPDRFVLPYTRDGVQLQAPSGVPDPRAIAWSPDDRWTALATERSVYIFPSEEPDGPLIRVPLAVHDLDWAEASRS
jgi:hypothetical protein